ncbi:hypothetical protein PsYK624_095730 [Phanerochaete sordida]|uniref:Uncharacterized protein n=1 Tax=Phanerochaete sordida TaxID=48140 RepID=A0A9P3LG92_9APHY|nr:hypothetical protein PsYK624_095730 [Phanerochaete sordida]
MCKEAQGAALRLKSKAHAEDTFPNRNLESYILRYYDDWHAYATTTLSQALDWGDIVVVTGWTKTTADWEMTTWSNKSSVLGAALEGQGGGIAKIKLGGSRTRSVTSTPIRRHGRTYEEQDALLDEAADRQDQCIFVRRVKVKKRPLAPSRLVASAGHRRDGESDHRPGSAGSSTTVGDETFDFGEAMSKAGRGVLDLLDVLLAYILEARLQYSAFYGIPH